MYAYHMPNSTGHTFLDYDKMTQNHYTFMGSTQTDVTKDYYDIVNYTIVPKLVVNIHLGHIGNSSLNSVAEVVDKDTGKVFVTNTNQVVCVSKQTRKPAPLPDWWRDQYKDSVMGNQKLIVPLIDKPDQTHCYEVKVGWRDIDAYKHTNYATYLEYCQDAAMDAMHQGVFSKLTGEITNYHIGKTRVLYKGESKACDNLHVHTWENTNNPYILHFQIEKDGILIHQNTVHFIEPQIASL